MRCIDSELCVAGIDMINDTKLTYIRRRKVSWCSITYEIVPFKRLIQEHYWERAIRKMLSA